MAVSIIIPFYNSEEYIDRCVESCLAQLYDDIEIILVNDGSIDNSLQICESYSDHRIRIVNQDNSGASLARNVGLDSATGDYVLFVDSDDWIDPEMVYTMVKVAQHYPEAQVIQTTVPRDMRHQKREGSYTAQEAIKCLLEGSWWGPVCKLIKRDALGEIRFPKETISEDYLFNYKLFSNINRLYYFNSCFYHRTVRQGSLSKIELTKRKFDEYYNVKTVSELVETDYPQFLSLADSHLAGTCLKLLLSIFNTNSEHQYSDELDNIIGCIRTKYGSFMRNPHIPKRERILLSTCFSKPTARLTERLYNSIK